MKLLIDANILIDVLQRREPHFHDSSIVWKICETNQAQGCISALTFANLVYVMRKELTPEKIEETLRLMSLIFDFIELSSADLINAAEKKWSDFEDALQSATAERIYADYIITRNVRDFVKSNVMAFTPSELIIRINDVLPPV